MSRASFSYGLIYHIGNAQQPLAQARAIGETFIETWFLWI